MSGERDAMPIFYKTALKPAGGCVVCPVCTAEMEVDVVEDEAGVFHGDGADQFPQCPECGALMEVASVMVQEAEDE